jgi:hypothetical protein
MTSKLLGAGDEGRGVFTEDDILIACALRFDGYGYLQDHPLDHDQAVRSFCQTGEWRISPAQQLTVFFLLQRFLYKWGGETLLKTSATWRAFRSLFLLVCEYEIPEQYRQCHYYEEWVERYVPALADHAGVVRGIHEGTDYRSDDVVDPAAFSIS